MRCYILGLALAALAVPAHAQGNVCGERETIVQRLAEKYGEVPVARGVQPDGTVMEIFAAPGGSFSVLISRADGVSCLATAGEGFELVAAPVGTAL